MFEQSLGMGGIGRDFTLAQVTTELWQQSNNCEETPRLHYKAGWEENPGCQPHPGHLSSVVPAWAALGCGLSALGW